MATKSLGKVKVAPDYEEVDYDALLEKRKKLQAYTPTLAGTGAAALQQRRAEMFGQGQDGNTEVGVNIRAAGVKTAQDQDFSSTLSNSEAISRAEGVGVHNKNVDTMVAYDAQVEAARKAQEEAAKARAKFTFKTTGTNSIDFSGMKIAEGSNVPVGGQIKFTDHNGRTGTLTMTQERAANANKIIAIGRQRGQSNEDIQIALAVAMDESKLINVKGGDRDSAGLFQQRPSQGWGSYKEVTNTDYAINKFYSSLSKKGSSPWMRAQNTQRSAFSDGSNYKGMWNGAGKILSYAINPVGNKATNGTPKNLKSFISKQNGQKTDFDKRYGTQCVDLYRYYMQSIGASRGPAMGGDGGAKNLWTNPAQISYMSQHSTRINKSAKAISGDVAVFGGQLGGGYGHVGIVVSDNGDTVTLFNSHAGNKATDFTTISKKYLSGYYRPNR